MPAGSQIGQTFPLQMARIRIVYAFWRLGVVQKI